MTKLEELKAAFEAATPGEWRTFEDDESTDVMDKHGDHILTMCGLNDSRDATFIALAHKLMPTLLEVVEAAQNLVAMKCRYNTEIAYGRLEQTLEKLKQ